MYRETDLSPKKPDCRQRKDMSRQLCRRTHGPPAVVAERDRSIARAWLLIVATMSWLGIATSAAAADAVATFIKPFAIQVVDEQTKRGVPLVELKTIPDQTYVTDSNGYVAIDDPSLMGQNVFFHVSSHGYEYPQDGFGYRGQVLQVEPGGEATILIKRVNIAERLYRITGAGIYRDSVKLGKQVPLEKPLINALVTGQDSVQTVVKGDRIYWFWGDTDRLRYPLGHFNTSGAVSLRPSRGGLDPSQGINLEYFTDAAGFSRPMFKRENGVLIWVHGVFRVHGRDGEPKILAHYSRRKSLEQQLSHGLAVLDEDRKRFEPIVQYDEDQQLHARGHAFTFRDQDTDYICFADPYALIRVPATWEAVIDAAHSEAFTPLTTGSLTIDPKQLDRTVDGRLNYGWKKNTAPVDQLQHQQWIRLGVIDENENWLRTIDAATDRPIQLHRGSIQWNEFRQRWIMIANQTGGSPSFLGEVWYAESRRPEGPFAEAVKIVTHNAYAFYNVSHHEFFDGQDGRLIYFEGTYSNSFSKSPIRTPWYDYNQIMYRLDLADPRLKPAFAE